MGEQIREVETKLKKLLELYLEDELDKETYRERKAQLDLQADQLERMQNAGAEDTEDILLRVSSIGSIISRGTPAQQKEALRAIFDRIEVDNEGRIVRLVPRTWVKSLFGCLTKENPAVEAGPISSQVHEVPPRGFELIPRTRWRGNWQTVEAWRRFRHKCPEALLAEPHCRRRLKRCATRRYALRSGKSPGRIPLSARTR
ncbi:MAG: hypothetical protein NT169_27605 [Chloroflexi bacterium]|nr:hypothetical protein [Chloroflexota bacterium]